MAKHGTHKLLNREILNQSRLEKLLRDSYRDYCIQTTLDYADASQRAMLVKVIRYMLSLIRNTPYGKRIQKKLQHEQLDNFGSNSSHYSHQAALLNMDFSAQDIGSPSCRPPQSPHSCRRLQLAGWDLFSPQYSEFPFPVVA